MSSFKIKAINKSTRVIHEIWALDDYFGKHRYGYIPNETAGAALTEEQFYQQYELHDEIARQNAMAAGSTLEEGAPNDER